MPFALIFSGLLMIVTGANNTYAALGTQLKADFTGKPNFVLYAGAIGAVGSLGYIPELRRFSHLFLALILVSLVIGQKGFFQNLEKGFAATPVAATAGATQTAVSPSASTATINQAITSNQSGLFGASPTSAGQAKFNGWLNYLLGLSTSSGS